MPDLFQNYPDIKDDILSIHRIKEEDIEELKHLFPYALSEYHVHQMLYGFENAFLEKHALIAGIYQERLIGVIEIYHNEGSTVEIGYRMTLQKQHLGFTKHAVGLMVEYLMGLDVLRIEAYVDEENIASMKVLEANGFQRCERQPRGIRYIKEK